MSAADGSIGSDFKLQLGDSSSPVAYADFCAAFELGEVGEESPLTRMTTFCSDAEEYKNGLPDGLEIPLRANFASGNPTANAQVRSLYTAFKNNTLPAFRLTTKASPADTWDFSATVRAWRMTGVTAGSDRAPIMFTLKISGGVNWEEGS